jgi:Protein of unknown function (DUF1566)/Putative Ig domain/Carboxypeptidase regulatory-like domain/Glucodextranase, domain B/Purple acid Phosphatase, N-terminal domain
MIKHLLLLLSLLLTFTTVLPAKAVELPQSGQTTSYAAGDDGDLKAGAPWPAPRFSDSRNGTISDNLTGLVWSRDANPLKTRAPGLDAEAVGDGSVTWQHALDYIKRLNAERYLGHNDWRLPNLIELASLLHQGQVVNSIWLSGEGFYSVETGGYWSASSSMLNPRMAWTVNIDAGPVGFIDKGKRGYVWPVRGGETSATTRLFKTGQSACFDSTGTGISCAGSGQDGELRTGAAWPVPRISINGDQTVTDNLTGLIWGRDANLMISRDPSFVPGAGERNGAVTWQDALAYVARLNGDGYLGYRDWRLPNRNELASVVNYAEEDPAAWLGDQGVFNVQQNYWSSGNSAVSPSNAWNVTQYGSVLERAKLDPLVGSYVWPVRGGLVADIQNITMAAPATATATLTVSTSTLPAGTAGTAYSQTLAATGGTTPYTWTRTAGSLPTGLTLTTAGVISGTPTTAATSTFTVQVKDKSAVTATKSLSITVNAAPLSITTASIADGYLTTAYSQTLAATGGKTAYTWSKTAGTLPAGLSLGSTGTISGTPTATGTGSFTVQVKDANTTTATKALTVTVYALPAISTASLPAGNVGVPYNQSLTATGGKTAYTWSVSSGTLPAGLTLVASTGVISGTPTTVVTSSVTFKVTDANAKTATKALSITINATPPSITTTTLANGYAGVSYSQTLVATGGKTSYTWSRTAGSLPAGLTLSGAGVISGTPTTAGTSSFTVQVKDANTATATAQLTIVIVPAISIPNNTSLPFGTLGVAYNQVLSASGGKLPYTWSLPYGPASLPTGLSLNSSTGAISGTPALTGNNSFYVQVTDVNNMSAYGTVFLDIYPPVIITTPALHNSFIGVPYFRILAATGGLPPFTWSVSNGTLPAGLTLDPSTGVISGIPTSINASSFTIQAQDTNNTVASKLFSLTISGYGSIGGVVSDQLSGAPLQGVTVMLNLSYKVGNNSNDKAYSCGNTPFAIEDYSKVDSRDETKFSCWGHDFSYFKVRNPFGVLDPFTLHWNGLSAYSGDEYLAQSFKPTKTGVLNRVSLYFSGYAANYSPSQGAIYVLLKSSLGGDRGNYLAHSARVTVSPSTATGWYDFDFVTPVSVTAGQEYFFEIQGEFPDWEFTNGVTYYDFAEWGNGVAYADGHSYQRTGGIWGQLDNSLAFRTYVDVAPDIVTPLPSQSATTHGSAAYAPYILLSNPTSGGYEVCDIDYVHNVEFNSDNNSANFNCSKAVSKGGDYYDQNGWITSRLYSSSNDSPATRLVTDQFDITFNRVLTAKTDANGAYSFSGLPDGNYTVTYGGTKTSSGTLNPGQQLGIDIQLPSLPPLVVNITSPSDRTLINSSATIAVSGTISTNGAVSINGVPATVANNTFSAVISLIEGLNTITATATNLYGQIASTSITVIYNATPRMVAVPGTLDYGAVWIGGASTLSVTVTNTSAANLALGMITRPSAPFWVISDTCSGTTIPPAATCRITAQFIPTTLGTFTGELAVPLAEAEQQHLAVALKGTSVAFNGYYLPDTGQSGDLSRNPLNYTINSDKVATDNNTRLMWERDGSSGAMSWADAGAHCGNLVKDGYTGWRLPTFVELDTIVHYGNTNPAIDSQTFPSARPDYYWTSTLDATYPDDEAIVLDFGYGDSQSRGKSSSAYARCVRGTPLSQNGTVFEGNWMNPSDGGKLNDLDSGLTWMYSYIEPDVWNRSLNACPNVNYGGRANWRTPTIKELATLTLPTCELGICNFWSTTLSNRPDWSGQLTQVFAGGLASDIVSIDKTAISLTRCVSGGNKAPRDSQKISVTPPVLDFGYPLFGNSADRILTVSNAGTGSLTVGAIPAPGEPFAIVSDGCSGRALPGGGSCTVTVRFLSSSAGLSSGSFTIPSNDADTPNITVPMIGTAALPDTALSGKATDSEGTPIAGVTIAVTDASNVTQTVITTAGGNYVFTTPPTGAFSGAMTKAGYSSFAFSGTLASQQKLTINGTLSPILPIISNLALVNIAANSAMVQWATNQATAGTVEYGETGAYGISTTESSLTTQHSVTVTSLKPLTTYHFRVISTNGYGISATSADQTFMTPLFSARHLGDQGNVAVIEVSGNYDAKNPDNSINDQPRKTIATEYFKTHADVDFLIFLSTFDYALPEAGAQGFYLPVKNDTQGINQAIMDNTAAFGSQGKLQGTIDMGNVTSLAANPYGPKLDETLTVLNHEIGHRWGSYVRFKNPDGTFNSSLLGKDSAHWSYLLDSRGSLMYGNGWKANGDGTFTSTSKQSAYSPLDLYLMGLIDKSQVSPMLLIDNPAIDKTQLPQLGATVTGTAKTVTIDDIIAAEGPRIPNATTAQKQFNVGFVLLTRAGDNATAATQAIETLRKAWAGRFAELTQGKGSVANIPASLEITVDSPADGATITGPDVTVSGTVINSSGVETGVMVNGMPATVNGNRFIVNHVSLQVGSNSITVAATDANGLTSTTTKTVTAQAGNYIRLTTNIESGVAPMDISLRLNGSFIITNPTMAVTGPVQAILTVGASSTEFTATLSTEGTYTFTASAVGPDGLTYSDTMTITLLPRFQLENLLKGKWDGMKAKLAANDVDGALGYFASRPQAKYREFFTALGTQLQLLNDYLKDIEMVYMTDGNAKCRLYRDKTIMGQVHKIEYVIYFVQENGIWKLYQF